MKEDFLFTSLSSGRHAGSSPANQQLLALHGRRGRKIHFGCLIASSLFMLIPPSPPADDTIPSDVVIRFAGRDKSVRVGRPRGSIRFSLARLASCLRALNSPSQLVLSAQLIGAVRPAITGAQKPLSFVASPKNPRAF